MDTSVDLFAPQDLDSTSSGSGSPSRESYRPIDTVFHDEVKGSPKKLCATVNLSENS